LDLVDGLVVEDVGDAVDRGEGFFEGGVWAEKGLEVELDAEVDGSFLGSFAVGFLRVVEVGGSFGA